MAGFSCDTREYSVERAHLMVNVMIVSVVAREQLERVEWQGVSTVVVDGLEGGNCEQKCSLAEGHSRYPLSEDSTTRIKKEALDGMVVQRTERVRYVQPMVPGVECLV